MTQTKLDKVLFVDDEEAVLSGFRRALHGEFDLHVAQGGPAGLITLREKGPFTVVVSDMRMPGMSGAQFLAQVREISPLTTRILLTGYSDAQDAAEAVNQGEIFRFLSKPCPREVLEQVVRLGIARCKDLMAEKALSEGTLAGSVQALSQILDIVNPLSFERSSRISRTVNDLVAVTPLADPWQVKAAGMLSQIGCLAQPPELLRAAYRGAKLPSDELKRYAVHPQAASDLLATIPQMQSVAWIIRNQEGVHTEATPEGLSAAQVAELKLGAEILRMATVFDTLWLQGIPHAEILLRLRTDLRSFPRVLIAALDSIRPPDKAFTPRLLPVDRLSEGMIMDEDILNKKGALLVSSGHLIGDATIRQLERYVDEGLIKQVRVLASA